MAGFRRVFTQFPGFDVLGSIESVNIIDVPPPASPLGAGSGVVCVVGEFEKGPLNAPTRVFGGSDLEAKFGGFGHTYDGTTSQFPVAVRSAGSADYWNGNGFIALRNKRFAGLVVVRVDNSAGDVEFSRLACITGGKAPFDLANGDTLLVSVDGGPPVTATFTGAKASITGSGGTYPTGFVGGETLELSIDGQPTLVVTFTAAEQTLAQVIAKVNAAAAATIAFDNGGELELRSLIGGTAGSIEVVGGTALATLGFPTAPVPQVDTYTVNSNTGGGAFTVQVQAPTNGQPVTYQATYTAGAGDTVTQVRDGLLNALSATGIPGITFAAQGAADITATGDANVAFTSTVLAEPAPGDLTIATTTAPVLTEYFGTGNVANIDRVSQAEVAAIVGALAGVAVDTDKNGNLRLCATTTPNSGSIAIGAPSTAAAALGLPVGTTVFANQGGEVTIPAGTRVRDTVTGAVWVTLEDLTWEAGRSTPLAAKVRPAVDDDTTPTSSAGNVTEVLDTLDGGFVANNPADLNRLTAAQMDARYMQAIESTIDVSGVAFDINIIYSARTSEQIMLALRDNARTATATGHRARKAVVAPPLGTDRATAKGGTGVGVGNVGREQRVFYVFPGLRTFIPEIAAKGAAGGPGFTDDGIIDVRADGFYASVASILPPEENRGQQLSDTNYGPMNATGLEAAYDKELGGVGLTIDDYIDFKANGIVAPRSDRVAGLVFQSDVTSVNPSTQPELVDAKRRFMGDFIIDTLGDIAKGYVKKLNTPIRRRAFLSTISAFLETLKSPNQPETSRIEDYRVVDDTSAEQRAAGFQIVNVAVRLFASMDFIVFRTTVGTTVNVEEIENA